MKGISLASLLAEESMWGKIELKSQYFTFLTGHKNEEELIIKSIIPLRRSVQFFGIKCFIYEPNSNYFQFQKFLDQL